MGKYLGVNIGGTNCSILYAEVDTEVKILDKCSFATNANDGFQIVFKKLMLNIDTMFQKYSNMGITSIGISCGGPLNSETGVILSPPNLPGWDNVEIVKLLEEKYQIPVYLENDANAGALVEWKLGAGKGKNDVVFLTMGTGMGAGIISGGRLIRGKNSMAGEIGHLRLAQDGPIGFGKYGSFEGFCSGGGIGRFSEYYLNTYCKDSVILKEKEISARVVAEYAKKGNPEAIEIYKQIGTKLGEGISLIIDTINPETIVIGSIFERSGELLRPTMEAAIQKEAIDISSKVCEVVPAKMGDEIGDYSSIIVALYNEDPDFEVGEYIETKEEVLNILEDLLVRYPNLTKCKEDIFNVYVKLYKAYLKGKKILVCGNGGSASDSEHIVGELMKGFMKKRPLTDEIVSKLTLIESEKGKIIADNLQMPLRAIALTGSPALSTAFINDVSAENVFAQQVLGYGDRGDVFIGITTSGNSKNVVNASIVAKSLGLLVVALVSDNTGEIEKYADVVIKAPAVSTPFVQELHLPIYHTLCAMVEAKYFEV